MRFRGYLSFLLVIFIIIQYQRDNKNDIDAIKIGKGSLLIPAEHVNELKQYFQKKKVAVKLYDVWSDSEIR